MYKEDEDRDRKFHAVNQAIPFSSSSIEHNMMGWWCTVEKKEVFFFKPNSAHNWSIRSDNQDNKSNSHACNVQLVG